MRPTPRAGARTASWCSTGLSPSCISGPWTFDDATSSIWFRHDGQIKCLAGVTNSGALTVLNADSWAIASVPGTYADAVPVDGGRLATMTKDGTLAFIDDPVAGP